MGSGSRIAYAVVPGDDPVVVLAEDEETLTRAVALRVVATTRAAELGGAVSGIRQALLEDQWLEAVQLWMSATGLVVDGYPSERVWSQESLDDERTSMELRMMPIFND